VPPSCPALCRSVERSQSRTIPAFASHIHRLSRTSIVISAYVLGNRCFRSALKYEGERRIQGMLFNPWFASNPWLKSYRRMLFAPWIIPLQVAQAVFAGDFTGLSEGIGQRSAPSGEAQRSQPRADAMERLAARARPHSQAVGGVSPAHSDGASKGHRPLSLIRAARTAISPRTQRASAHGKSKHKRRRVAGRAR